MIVQNNNDDTNNNHCVRRRRRGRDIERENNYNNKRIRTVSPEPADNDGAAYNDNKDNLHLCQPYNQMITKLCLLMGDNHDEFPLGTSFLINAVDELYSFLIEHPLEFLEIFLECNGSQHLLQLIQKYHFDDDCCNNHNNLLGIAAQKASILLGRCLFYSQSQDGKKLLSVSKNVAKQVIIDNNGIEILLHAIQRCRSSVWSTTASKYQLGSNDPSSRWRIVSDYWILLNNMTLFDTVVTKDLNEKKHEKMVRLVVTTALDFLLDRHCVSSRGGTNDDDKGTHSFTALLITVWSSVFGVLSNLLACSHKNPLSSCVDSVYIELQAVPRCINFVQSLGDELLELTYSHRTLLGRVFEFFYQCTRRPLLCTNGFSKLDYQDFLLPLCVESVMTLFSPSPQSSTSATEMVKLCAKLRLHACLILSKCNKSIDKSSMIKSGALSVLKIISSQPRKEECTVLSSNSEVCCNILADSSTTIIKDRLTQQLALKLLRQLCPVDLSWRGLD
jgi:hypothetical protein